MKFFFGLTPLLLIAGIFFPGGLRGQAASGPFALPTGNFVTPDGKAFLAIRPGNRLYFRREGEDRFSFYRTKVSASVRNEYWVDREEALASETAPQPTAPGAGPVVASVPEGGKPPAVEPNSASVAWFADSTRLVLIFGPLDLEILFFEGDEPRGTQKFRRIKQRLAVPDHAEG